ncbi:hypothetical protein C8R44DRAFT_895539 [Mycena epipterygia]|nr:hypothetical protein C8R44DRAFT_895539 [Mycena epipterygia]
MSFIPIPFATRGWSAGQHMQVHAMIGVRAVEEHSLNVCSADPGVTSLAALDDNDVVDGKIDAVVYHNDSDFALVKCGLPSRTAPQSKNTPSAIPASVIPVPKPADALTRPAPPVFNALTPFPDCVSLGAALCLWLRPGAAVECGWSSHVDSG